MEHHEPVSTGRKSLTQPLSAGLRGKTNPRASERRGGTLSVAFDNVKLRVDAETTRALKCGQLSLSPGSPFLERNAL